MILRAARPVRKRSARKILARKTKMRQIMRLLLPLVVTAICTAKSSYSAPRAQIEFGSEYSCNSGQTRFIVKSCKPIYTFETCQVQYLNAAAAGGLGAQVDVRREMVEANLQGCTIAGKAVAVSNQQEGEPGEARWLGTWYDVRVLDRKAGKVHVRFSSGTEDWLDAALVRAKGSPATNVEDGKLGSGTLPEGRYTCMGWIGPRAVNFGFVEVKGQSYRGPSHSSSGDFAPFTVSADGALTWSKGFGEFNNNGTKYQSAKVVPGQKPHFTVHYLTASGRAEALDCGRE